MKQLIFLLLFTSAIFAQSGKSVLTQAQKDSINDIIERYINDSTLVDDIIADSTVLKHRYSGSAYSSKDTIIFGGSSLTPFYNRGVVGAVDVSLQGKFQINKGLNILPDSYYGYSNLNLYQGGGSNGSLGSRGLGGINFNYYDTTNRRYQPLMQMGIDVAQSLTSDGRPPFFFIGARDSLNITNDLFGIVLHNYTLPLGAGNRYRGQFNFNSMGLNYGIVNIATIGTKHPSSYSLLNLHRTSDDSTNNWLKFTHGNSGLLSFVMSDEGSMTWYNPTNGSYSYLTGDGFSFNLTSNNNLMEIQGGGLDFRGGTLQTYPNRTDWDSPSFSVVSNNTDLLPFKNNSGIKLRNANNTIGSRFSIYNSTYNSGSITSSIDFINIDQTSKGAITFNTKDTDTQGERVRITEGGHLILKAIESDITASQMTTNDIAIYLKDNKLKIAYLIGADVYTKSLNLITADSVFKIEDTLGVEILANKSFETLISGALDDGTTDDWLDWGESAGSGLVEAVTASKFNNGVKLKNNTGLTYGDLGITQTVTVTAETNYRLTFWTKGDGTNSGAHRIRDLTNVADIVVPSLGNNSVSGTTWTQKSIDFTTPAGCISVLIYLYGHTTNGSIIYYDSASLKEIL